MGAVELTAAGTPRPGLGRSLVEAALVAVGAAVVGLAVNLVRPDGLPLVARAPYETLVPCPEPGGPVEAMEAGGLRSGSTSSFVIDARAPSEYAARHLEGAVSVPYDWLDPVPDATLAELARAIAASGARRVVVYGDGGRPDSGEYLGREISARGIKNVYFIRGGAPAAFAEAGP